MVMYEVSKRETQGFSTCAATPAALARDDTGLNSRGRGVLRRVNDSIWGLQAGLFTRDARLIFRAFEELQVSGVIAGGIPTWRMDQMPCGEVKDSGTGREGLKYAIEEMTERKLLVINLQ